MPAFQLGRGGLPIPLRIGFLLVLVLASSLLAYVFFIKSGSHIKAAAPTGAEITLPGADPWDVQFDNNGNVWIAVPNCDPNPVCPGQPVRGNIIQVNKASFAVAGNYAEPAGYSSPVFLTTDGAGNIWFSEPTSNAIGELTPGPAGGAWHQWTVPTANAAPFGLAFDAHGNLWFTEALANKIGEFNPTTQQFSETATPTASSKPYGITGPDPSTGAMWFTENNPAVARVASFVPPASGALTSAGIKEYIASAANANSTPHRITYDGNGNIWWTEGPVGKIGRLVIAQAKPNSNAGVTEIQVPAPTCTAGCGTHISGIGVDGAGVVWLDDSLSSRVIAYSPSANSFTQYVLGGSESSNAHPHDGLAIDSSNTVYFSEEFANKLGRFIQTGIANPPATSKGPFSAPATPPGPVSARWYFAEGRVGGGFREYLTIENPGKAVCPISIQYQYTMDGSTRPATKTVTQMVSSYTRITESVNADLGIADIARPAASLSTVVAVTTGTSGCAGVVAERPMYFSGYHGLSSGTDAVGSTQLSTSFSFADVPSGSGVNSFLTILNPGKVAANVTATYFAGGKQVGRQTVTVAANARGTVAPGAIVLPGHVAAVVTSTQPVMVERPSYFTNMNGVSGAADVVGSSSQGNDWLLAEGYAAANSREDLAIANVSTTPASVTITLKSRTGATQSYTLAVASHSQTIWNVNSNDQFVGATPEVSAEVKSTGAPIVVQREMYFHYHHTLPRGTLQSNCVTDVMALPAAALKSAYSFAEGYTNLGYNTWLTIQNPTANTETIYVTLVNGNGQVYVGSFPVVANSRATIDVTALVQANMRAGTSITANAVSMTVQTLGNGGRFIAERPEYWNTHGISSFATAGGSDVIGF